MLTLRRYPARAVQPQFLVTGTAADRPKHLRSARSGPHGMGTETPRRPRSSLPCTPSGYTWPTRLVVYRLPLGGGTPSLAGLACASLPPRVSEGLRAGKCYPTGSSRQGASIPEPWNGVTATPNTPLKPPPRPGSIGRQGRLLQGRGIVCEAVVHFPQLRSFPSLAVRGVSARPTWTEKGRDRRGNGPARVNSVRLAQY